MATGKDAAPPRMRPASARARPARRCLCIEVPRIVLAVIGSPREGEASGSVDPHLLVTHALLGLRSPLAHPRAYAGNTAGRPSRFRRAAPSSCDSVAAEEPKTSLPTRLNSPTEPDPAPSTLDVRNQHPSRPRRCPDGALVRLASLDAGHAERSFGRHRSSRTGARVPAHIGGYLKSSADNAW